MNLAGGMCAWAAAGLPVVTARDAGLVVHRADPLNCETSIPALIGGVVMPNARFYVRNHFDTPALDAATWRLAVSGLVERPLRLSLRDLQNMRSHTLVVTLECAGNGRSMFRPPVEGEPWHLGAVSTAEWATPSTPSSYDCASHAHSRAEVVAGRDPGKRGIQGANRRPGQRTDRAIRTAKIDAQPCAGHCRRSRHRGDPPGPR